MSQRIAVGTLSGAFGVKGEVRLKSYCADPEAIVDYAPLYDETGKIFSALTITGQAKGALTARIHGIESKEEADAWRNTTLYADRDRLPNLPDDEYYYSDLIGLEVFDTGGVLLGRVKIVNNHGAGDLLEIALPKSSETVMLPFTMETVPTVDLKAGRIIADPPLGLMPVQKPSK